MDLHDQKLVLCGEGVGGSGFSVKGVGIVTGTLSGVVVLYVDGPEGKAEPRKYRNPRTLLW